jgi:epoxyqueuosine reductase
MTFGLGTLAKTRGKCNIRVFDSMVLIGQFYEDFLISSSPFMDAHQRKEAIIGRAVDLELSLIGFAQAEPPARADFFRAWLADGKAGTMTYLHRSADRRVNPRLIMPDAQTVICVAVPYFSGWLPDAVRNDPARGIISCYAAGPDYHDRLFSRISELAQFVETLVPGTQTKCYADTGPILERDFAERAGLGFIGKNTLLIAPHAGSLLFLGEILTTLSLPPTHLQTMPSCGSCTRCLEVCPTHALPVPYVLDSNLCISYLTIEYKGIIPRELRNKIGNHLFGCDDCQTCCPWTQRFSALTHVSEWKNNTQRQAPLLNDLAYMTEHDLHKRFTGTPVLRAGYIGFLRNVAIALGNWKSESALVGLSYLLNHSSSLVRVHAVWAVGQISCLKSKELLQTATLDAETAVREEAAVALLALLS